MTNPRTRVTRWGGALAAVALIAPLAACTENTPAAKPGDAAATGAISVASAADACTLSATSAPSGNVVFNVTNTGSDVTEFYLLAEDGLRIVSEVENIGPGISRDLVVVAKPGKYTTACKPGMVGDGIRADFTVTDSGAVIAPVGALGEQIEAATRNYVAYVQDQTGQLVTGTPRVRCTHPRGCTGSGSNRSRNPSETLTPGWICAKPTCRTARSGRAGTCLRRTCGPPNLMRTAARITRH